MTEKILSEVETPLGFIVRFTQDYWRRIVENKHPVMKSRQSFVKKTFQSPDEIRRSRRDPDVYLFYRKQTANRWICAIAKKLNRTGLLITTYPTDAIKEGDVVWIK